LPSPRYPSLFQIGTRVRLAEIAGKLGRPGTLDDVIDAGAHDSFGLTP
jgi:hypothetical protein